MSASSVLLIFFDAGCHSAAALSNACLASPTTVFGIGREPSGWQAARAAILAALTAESASADKEASSSTDAIAFSGDGLGGVLAEGAAAVLALARARTCGNEAPVAAAAAVAAAGGDATMAAVGLSGAGTSAAADFSAVAATARGPKALILVDIQNDFCGGGALAVPDGDAVVRVANALRGARAWDLVVFTQDWHPAGHSSFASTHGRPPFSTMELPGAPAEAPPQVLWPDHCVQGSPGAAFHVDLVRAPTDVVVRKGTVPAVDSYSGFGDAQGGAIERTELESLLRARGVESIFVVGLALDYCVLATCTDAARAGFATTCIADVTRAITPEGAAAAAAAMRKAGVALAAAGQVPTAALDAALSGPLAPHLARWLHEAAAEAK